jgi:hypothetical protein
MMDAKLRRRRFLQSASALGLTSCVGWRAITPARAAEMAVGPEAVRFRPEIEPVVEWIEETPRDRVLDVAVDQLKAGLSYRDLLAGLFLAGIRNIQPRPVGFKFHAVLVINSAHLLGQTAAVSDRLLPLFWALDNFKASQAQDVKEGDWTLAKVDEGRVPKPGKAEKSFIEAMEAWDVDAADAAVAALCRTAGAAEAMGPFWRMGTRDFRNIGHKAIFTMQCWRTLQVIGWPNAEPVLRSLAYGMLDTQGDSNPAPLGPYEANLAASRTVRDGWQVGSCDPGATQTLLEAMRHEKPEEASREAVTLLNRGVSPDSLWDAVVLCGGELMMRQPGILPIHAVTSANALHYIFGASGDETTRKLALLQAVAWQAMFRDRMKAPDGAKIDALEAKTSVGGGEGVVGEVFSTLDKDRGEAARMALGYLAEGGSPDLIFAAGRRMIFHKGIDSHDYKYGAAAWEEFRLASDPKFRAPLVAAALFNLPGSGKPDSPLMRRAREAISRAEVG